MLRQEVVALLAPLPAGLVLDLTVGGAGHARALLEAAPELAVLGMDRDPEAVAAAAARLAPFARRARVVQASFTEVGAVLEGLGERGGAGLPEVPDHSDHPPIVGALLDLGVSSPQLDRADRGFSYRQSGVLDMRMDPTGPVTAADIVNEASPDELAEMFAASGEGRLSRRIARAIVAARPITTTDQLAAVVADAVPAPGRRRGHPARRVFQALRIAVNAELDQLAQGLPAVLDLLAPGGRAVVIAYHSGEDRLVKEIFRDAERGGCQCPPGLPCVCGAQPRFRLVFRGARRPTPEEVARNHRAESARLRAVERLASSGADGPVAR